MPGGLPLALTTSPAPSVIAAGVRGLPAIPWGCLGWLLLGCCLGAAAGFAAGWACGRKGRVIHASPLKVPEHIQAQIKRGEQRLVDGKPISPLREGPATPRKHHGA